MSNTKFGNKREKEKSAVAAEFLAAGGSAAGSRKVAAPGDGTARKEESARKRKSRERMEKYIREEIEKNKAKEKKRQEQQLAGGAGERGGGEVASAAAMNEQTAPGPAGDPARDAGQDQVGTNNVQEQQLVGGAGGQGRGEAASAAVQDKVVKNVQEQQLAGGAGGQGGGEAASAAVQDKVVKEKEAKSKGKEISLQSEAESTRMDEDMLVDGEDGMKDIGDITEEIENVEENEEMGGDLATLTCPELRARCKERGLRSRGSKADLLVRLRDPEELRPLPQLRDRDSGKDKDKVMTPVRDGGRKTECWNCEAEMTPEHKCDEEQMQKEKQEQEEQRQKEPEPLCRIQEEEKKGTKFRPGQLPADPRPTEAGSRLRSLLMAERREKELGRCWTKQEWETGRLLRERYEKK
jgi:hypothetical protein